jgi:hypothetical protein
MMIGMTSRCWQAIVVSGVAVAVLLTGFGAALASANPVAGYCSSPAIGDYGAPLRHFPPMRRPPLGRSLPFGPAGLQLVQSGDTTRGPLVMGGRDFGYVFTKSELAKHVELGWTVEASLFSVNEMGARTGRVRRSHRYLKSTGKLPEISLDVPQRVGFYLFYLEFRQGNKTLGSFGEYLRVLDPLIDVRLGLKHATYSPGDTLVSRLENIGTQDVAYGFGYAIEQLTPAGWLVVGPSRNPGPRSVRVLPAGRAGECVSYRIPADMPEGHYRIGKWFLVGPFGSEETPRYNEFDIAR